MDTVTDLHNAHVIYTV